MDIAKKKQAENAGLYVIYIFLLQFRNFRTIIASILLRILCPCTVYSVHYTHNILITSTSTIVFFLRSP